MTTTTRWWWVRHAPVRVNDGRIYGQVDHPCDCSDERLFSALAGELPRDAVWVTSTLLRTIQTADALRAAGAAGEEPLREPAFVEQSFGDWQGIRYADLPALRGASVHRFWLAPAHEAPPGGESFVDLIERVSHGIDRLTEAHRGRDIVAVTHGGTIRAAIAHALQLPPETALAFSVDNVSLTRLDHVDGPGLGHGWRVAVVNRMAA
ncbi:MAG: histidine phosphatase family protein [Alphaproteobacteria bacterium]|nr:histidine phosphatase family protein [Alphaproteobacteria bacterium]